MTVSLFELCCSCAPGFSTLCRLRSRALSRKRHRRLRATPQHPPQMLSPSRSAAAPADGARGRLFGCSSSPVLPRADRRRVRLQRGGLPRPASGSTLCRREPVYSGTAGTPFRTSALAENVSPSRCTTYVRDTARRGNYQTRYRNSSASSRSCASRSQMRAMNSLASSK